MPITLALGKQRQEDKEPEASLSYIETLSQNTHAHTPKQPTSQLILHFFKSVLFDHFKQYPVCLDYYVHLAVRTPFTPSCSLLLLTHWVQSVLPAKRLTDLVGLIMCKYSQLQWNEFMSALAMSCPEHSTLPHPPALTFLPPPFLWCSLSLGAGRERTHNNHLSFLIWELEYFNIKNLLF